MEYYQRLKDLREDADKKQSEIAYVLQTTQQQYSRWESGAFQMPFEHYKTLAKFYNVSIDYLAGLIETPKPLNEKFATPLKSITTKEQKILKAYKEHPKMQEAIDKLLDI